MKLPQFKQIKWNYLALAFGIPVLGILIIMLCKGCTPFGTASFLYSDMYHQYYPFFVAFRKALLSGESLLYSWNVGMGMDYLGLISYYLASPLNLLSVIVPEGLLLEYFSLLMPIKLGLASLFFALFLKKMFGKDDLSITLFGVLYGLCAWALGYQWNIMWLDTFALLPLVALGTVRLLRDRKILLYTVTLFLSVFSNYYIGFFTCIFVLLLFICYQICRWQGFGRFFADLLRIAFFSILAIGMTAILELPALAALQTTQSSVNAFPKEFRLNIASEHNWKGLLDAMRQVAGNMGGGMEPTFKEGLPNLYCGVGSVVLAILFLTSKDVKLRDKLCSVGLLLFFNVSFIIRQLDYIWHGFHFTNMIPYRFSFLHSFVLLYMAYRAWLLRRSFQLWQILVAAFLSSGIFLCSENIAEIPYLAFNFGFWLFYIGAAVYAKLSKPLPKAPVPPEEESGEEARLEYEAASAAYKAAVEDHREDAENHYQSGKKLLALILAVEIVLNLVCFGIYFPSTYTANYPKGLDSAASMIRYMHQREKDTLFYRAEVTHSQTLNDGALNGYNGVSTFTSSANVRVTEFTKRLGYAAKNTYNRYCYEESSPVANLFLNLKYMIERDGNVEPNAYFTEIHHFGDVYLLENNAYLPLGFLADRGLAAVDFGTGSDDFSFQNTLLRTAAGITGSAWTVIPDSLFSVTPNNATITTQSPSGYTAYENCGKDASIFYNYPISESGFLCIDVDFPDRNSFTVWKNGVQLYSESISLPQMLSVSDVVPGDVIEVRISCDEGDKSSVTVKAAILSESVFREAYEILSASTLELSTFTTTKVEGTILCDRDGLLYTSIPQNGENWTAFVDGEEAEIVLVGDAMIGLELTEGLHTVTFTYHNDAFSLGWKISLGCALLFAAAALVYYQPFRKKGKYER